MPNKKKIRQKCLVWFCDALSYSSGGYCPRHQRQLTRTGDPLAGDDAKYLNNMVLKLRHVLRGVMPAVITIDHNDIAHCGVCGAASAPHGKIVHKDGCAAAEARDILLSNQQ